MECLKLLTACLWYFMWHLKWKCNLLILLIYQKCLPSKKSEDVVEIDVFTHRWDIHMFEYSQLCISRICGDQRNSFDLGKIRLMRGPKQKKTKTRGQDWAFDLGDYSTYATSTYAELTVFTKTLWCCASIHTHLTGVTFSCIKRRLLITQYYALHSRANQQTLSAFTWLINPLKTQFP